jgi:4-hydroxy-tetrahydrodipicolinate synthase
LPVLVGITDTSITESYNLAAKAAECGADAVVSAQPYYYAAAQPELIYFYSQLADKLPLPLFLYNMPSHTKVSFDPATVRRLAEHKNIVGVKDSSANGTYFQKLCYELREVKDFTLLVGPEEMLAESVLLGGHGGVNGGANIFPKLYVELYNAAVARNFEKIIPLHKNATIHAIRNAFFRIFFSIFCPDFMVVFGFIIKMILIVSHRKYTIFE